MQYTIELGAACMEDGPPSDLTPPTRLALLRERQAAWKRLAWRSELSVMMTGGRAWELSGGVLGQSEGSRKLVFQQLPSQIRGIEARMWELSEAGTDIHDFSMDPAQDLLVVFEKSVVESATLCSLHLKSLLTGAQHPVAAGSAVLTHKSTLDPVSQDIRIAGDYIGTLLLTRALDDPSELLVWNWRTGERKLHVRAPSFCHSSFTFLSPRYILIADFERSGPGTPRILVLDLDLVSHGPVQLVDLEYVCEFLYPKLAPGCRVGEMTIRSDPAPRWKPHPSLQVPFSVAGEERLFVVAFVVAGELQFHSLLSFVPSSTLFTSLSSIPPGRTRHTFPWSEWGPKGSRFDITPSGSSAIWVCYVYGMSFVFLSRNGSQQIIKLLDFNQRDIRRARSDPQREQASQNGSLVTKATALPAMKVFEHLVRTSLPYREMVTSFDREREGWIDDAMIDEDSLILVSCRTQLFRVLTF